jgi:hypothetical protein
MDTLITFDEVVALVTNPPTLAPRPNFANVRALQCHLQCPLQRLSCPQSNILGWAGLVMSQAMYSLLTPTPFDSLKTWEIKPYTTAHKSPSSTCKAPLSSTRQATQRMSPNLHLIVPRRQRLMQDLYKRATTGSRTKTSSKHASTCSMITLTMPSKSPTAQRCKDGTS